MAEKFSVKREPGQKFVINPRGGKPSNRPDEFTKKDPQFIDGGAPNQIFRFDKWGVAYGTDDKGHAAAILLSVLLVALLFLVFIIGAIVERNWIGDALKFLGPAFTFTAGVAIGKSSSKK